MLRARVFGAFYKSATNLPLLRSSQYQSLGSSLRFYSSDSKEPDVSSPFTPLDGAEDVSSKVLNSSEEISQIKSPFAENAGRFTARKAVANFSTVNDGFSHILNVHSSMNNTILLLSNDKEKTLITSSCGTAGFKKARRAGFEPAYQATTQLIEKAQQKGVKVQQLLVKFKGFGPGREAAFRAIRANTDWPICKVVDTTPIPFNGCRPPKPRRL